MNSPPTPLPRINVSAPRPNILTDPDDIAIFLAFMEQYAGGHDPNIPDDSDDPVELPEEPSPDEVLENSAEFAKLPELLRQFVLASPTAVHQMARFLSNGGNFDLSMVRGPFEGSYDPSTNTIYLDSETINKIASGDNAEYNAGLLMTALGHELAHYVLRSESEFKFDPYGTEQDWVDYRSKEEALSGFNSMIISDELRRAMQAVGQTGEHARLTLYKLTHADMMPLWESYLLDQDFDSLIDTLRDAVLDSNWSGSRDRDGIWWDGTDLNGDGEVNQDDRYRWEYRQPRN